MTIHYMQHGFRSYTVNRAPGLPCRFVGADETLTITASRFDGAPVWTVTHTSAAAYDAHRDALAARTGNETDDGRAVPQHRRW